MKIFLIGFMTSGKSTLGKTIANRLDYNFIDLDSFFEEKFKISINDFFSKFGEDKFREIEHQLLLDVINKDNTIISTGGGTPCFFDNIDIINANGISIYLKLNYKSIISRLKQSKKQRPLVKDLNDKEFDEYIEQNLKTREEFYNKAQYIIKSENLTANELINYINENIKKI